jgi:cytidyltransferase-like protein
MAYSFFIGRWQPLHAGHVEIIRAVLNEGKSVCIGIRQTPISKNNPYTTAQREQMFLREFPNEMRTGALVVISIPDIDEVCFGREPGWSIRQIEVSEETAAISATAIRGGAT